MIRYGIFPIKEVLSRISPHKSLFEVDGRKFFVKMGSQRYKLFDKSIVCVKCKREGNYFALESSDEILRWTSRLISNSGPKPHYRMHPYYIGHFNLYSLTSGGKEILMTKDHIVPVSRGGRNMMTNYQVMCAICNNNKGNSTGSKFPKAEKFLYDWEKGCWK